MWKPALRDRLVEILPYCIVASSIVFGVTIEEYTQIGLYAMRFFLLFVVIWFILIDKSELIEGENLVDRLWTKFLLTGGIFLYTGVLVAVFGILIKKDAVKYVGALMMRGGLVGGVVIGFLTLSILAIISLFVSKK